MPIILVHSVYYMSKKAMTNIITYSLCRNGKKLLGHTIPLFIWHDGVMNWLGTGLLVKPGTFGRLDLRPDAMSPYCYIPVKVVLPHII